MKKLILILTVALSSSALADTLMEQTVEQNREQMQQGYDMLRDIDQQRQFEAQQYQQYEYQQQLLDELEALRAALEQQRANQIFQPQ